MGRDEQGLTNRIISFCLICDTPAIENVGVYVGCRVSLIFRSGRRRLGLDKHGLINGITYVRLICDTPQPQYATITVDLQNKM